MITRLRAAFNIDRDSLELLESTSRNMIFTTSALYLLWHIIATVVWSNHFSPSLWIISLLILFTIVVTLNLLHEHYFIAQLVWNIGLVSAVLAGMILYQQQDVIMLLAVLPLMAITTIGAVGTILVEALILLIAIFVPQIAYFPIIEPGYSIGLVLASLFTAFIGWGISSNLLAAISSSSYHFHEARRLLEETRVHRGEISRMLKEVNQVNYQLERLNEMLVFARKQADDARDDRDRFVLAVSHELRSPLNFILGFSDLMVNSPETYAPLKVWPAGLYEDVNEIYHSSTHLLRLINDILDLGQVEARQMTIYRESIQIDRMIKEVQEMAAPSCKLKGLYLETEVGPDLPSLLIDATRIRQVLLNLVNNAMRFTDTGGVTLRAAKSNGEIIISVEDTGSGIALEDQPKVFSEFRQVGHDSWRRREGSGLGLAISRRFVELHGGKIWFDSLVGKGSTFYFTLPVVVTTEMERPDWNTTEVKDQMRQRPAVLVWSRNPMAGGLLQQCLPDMQVVLLEKEEDLPTMVENHFPRALLVDRGSRSADTLPVQDLPYDLPVVRLNLPGIQEDSQELPTGVFAYLTKPVSRSTLENAVRSLNPSIRKLLVVDDDPAMLRFVTQALKSRQDEEPGCPEYTFLTAETGEQAVHILYEEEVDAILLDLDLPDISGWQVLEQTQKNKDLAQKPVLIISALDKPQVLLSRGQDVIELKMKRSLSQQELAPVLQAIISTVQPFYTRPASNPPPRLRNN